MDVNFSDWSATCNQVAEAIVKKDAGRCDGADLYDSLVDAMAACYAEEYASMPDIAKCVFEALPQGPYGSLLPKVVEEMAYSHARADLDLVSSRFTERACYDVWDIVASFASPSPRAIANQASAKCSCGVDLSQPAEKRNVTFRG